MPCVFANKHDQPYLTPYRYQVSLSNTNQTKPIWLLFLQDQATKATKAVHPKEAAKAE